MKYSSEINQYLEEIFPLDQEIHQDFIDLFTGLFPQNYQEENRVAWLLRYIPRFPLIFKYQLIFLKVTENMKSKFPFDNRLVVMRILSQYISNRQMGNNIDDDAICTIERLHLIEEIKNNLVDPYANRYMNLFRLAGLAQYFILIKESEKLLALMRLAKSSIPNEWQFFQTDGYIVGSYYGPRISSWDLPHHFSYPDWILILDPNMDTLERLPCDASTIVINGPAITEIRKNLRYSGDLFIVSNQFEYMNGEYLLENASGTLEYH